MDFYIRDVMITGNNNLIRSAKTGRKQRRERKRKVTKRETEDRGRKGRGRKEEK